MRQKFKRRFLLLETFFFFFFHFREAKNGGGSKREESKIFFFLIPFSSVEHFFLWNGSGSDYAREELKERGWRKWGSKNGVPGLFFSVFSRLQVLLRGSLPLFPLLIRILKKLSWLNLSGQNLHRLTPKWLVVPFVGHFSFSFFFFKFFWPPKITEKLFFLYFLSFAVCCSSSGGEGEGEGGKGGKGGDIIWFGCCCLSAPSSSLALALSVSVVIVVFVSNW